MLRMLPDNIDEQIATLRKRRSELVKQIWDIESDIICLREIKLKHAEVERLKGDVEQK